MAKRRERYELPYPVAALQALVADASHVGQALAFVEDSGEWGGRPYWRLRPAMAAMTGAEGLRLDFQVSPDGVVRWQGESPRLVSRGRIALVPRGPSATEVDLTLEMAGVGAARAIIEPLATLQIEGQMAHFIDRLQGALQLPAREGVEKHGCR